MAAGYPVPKFFFSVSRLNDDFSSATEIGFTEVSGLEYSLEAIEYRDGSNNTFSMQKLPGLKSFGDVTLSRAKIQNRKDANADFYNWINGTSDFSGDSVASRATAYRKDVVITLRDEEGNAVVTWTLEEAWPMKVTFTDLKSDENAVAIDQMVICYENLTVSYE